MYNQSELFTTQNEKLNIIHVGFHNSDSGPDFFNAQVRINEIKWAGNIEIHVNSSDWIKHRHSSDAAYENVILHVVYNHDCKILDVHNNELPTLELKNRINPSAIEKYTRFISQESIIPCSNLIREIDRVVLFQQMDKCLVNRIERKTEPIHELLKKTKYNWEQTAFILLAKNFGFITNSFPFEQLAIHTPHEILKRASTNLFEVESILFGQAGFLKTLPKSDYAKKLRENYLFIKSKYNLKGLKKSNWKFSRMRPAGFPTIRIAQFAVVLAEYHSIMNLLFEIANQPKSYRKLRVCASSFWDHHYSFEVPSPIRAKVLGDSSIENIIINTVVPILFCYSDLMHEESYRNKAIALLEYLKPEKNRITQNWHQFGISPANAAESQSIIEMNNEWCFKKKCLTCSIGTKILQRND